MAQGKHAKKNDSNSQGNTPKKKSKVKIIVLTLYLKSFLNFSFIVLLTPIEY